jgi:hypothetical protein
MENFETLGGGQNREKMYSKNHTSNEFKETLEGVTEKINASKIRRSRWEQLAIKRRIKNKEAVKGTRERERERERESDA